MFSLPQLSDLVTRVAEAFWALLPGADARVRPNNVEPTGKVFAGAMAELFGRLDYIGQQAFTSTAEGQWLVLRGAEYGMAPNPALLAQGTINVTATDALVIPEGTQFTLTNLQAYTATSAASLQGAGTVPVPVEALVAGSAANADPGAPATISAGISGPGASGATAAVDADGLTGGDDAEDTSQGGAFAQRILFRQQNPPAGGSPADYVRWGTAVSGVTRIFVERIWRGAGTVRIFPVFDKLFIAQGGVATPDYIASVASAIAAVQPADAIVTVVAPVAQPIDVVVEELTPNNSVTQNAVIAELENAFLRLGRVSAGDTPVSSMPYLATPFTFYGLWIQGAVNNAAGVLSASVPGAADVVIANGSIPVLGNVSFPPS